MRALKWLGGVVLILFVAVALFFAFGLNTLRGPIAKAVTKATGRELVIDGDLKPVWTWLHPRIRAEGVTFANAEWGKADYLLNANSIEATISVLPLFAGRVVLPEVHLQGAELSLERDAEGRKNWILKDPEEERESRFFIKLLTVDEGRLVWDDATTKTRLETELSTDDAGVSFGARGRWKGMPLEAKGHAGHVLSIRDQSTPFPVKGDIKIGATSAKLEGTLTGIVGFKGIDLQFERLAGKSMDELYDIIGLAFPATSPYTVSGRLHRTDGMWLFEDFAGKVGESDLSGTIRVETGKEKKRPLMRGDVTAKVLNFADLGALVGTNRPRQSGVLPDMPFAPERWESVDADVKINAGTVKRPKQLPIERFGARIQMRDRVLTLDPLGFGIAGGRLVGTVRLDGNREPLRGDVKMRVQHLQLAKLFPTVEQAQGAIGDLNGLIELSGTGDSVGKLLGSANGKVGVYMDEGKISHFLMELVALDLWDATRIKLKGDKEVDIRCAIADFGVKGGVMQANALVFDTAIVNIQGGGSINLKSEQMDLTLKPEPKDRSIGSLRSPLHVKGTFGEPDIGPDMGRIAAKGAGAILMGILNPLLAVLPLIEEGKGKDSPCAQLIAKATSSGRSSASGATAPRPPSRSKR